MKTQTQHTPLDFRNPTVIEATVDCLRREKSEMQAEIDRLKAINAELREALCTAAIGAIPINPSDHKDIESALYKQYMYVRGICYKALELSKAQQ